MMLHGVLSQCAPLYAAVNWPIRTVDMDECLEILDNDQGVLDLLRQAHKRGQYAEIRNLREWQFLRYFQIPDNLPPAKFHEEMSTIQAEFNTRERYFSSSIYFAIGLTHLIQIL